MHDTTAGPPGVILLYRLLNTDDKAYHKLFTEDEYVDFFQKFEIDYFSLDFIRTFYEEIDCQSIMPGYLSSAVGIYREWKDGRAKTEIRTIDDLADYTAHLLLTGLGGSE